MAHALHDPVRHNVWATAQLLEACGRLDPDILNATTPGTFGTIIATLQHTLDTEMRFLYRLLGREASYPWQPNDAVAFGLLVERAALLANGWEDFLASDVDGDRPVPSGGTATTPAGIFIAAVLYHGTEHRAHICTILSVSGHTPPSLTPWDYARACGRI